MSAYENPYKGCREGTGPYKKLNSNVPLEKYNAIKQLRLKEGTIQTTINLLWEKLIYECNVRGITDFQQSPAFERLVAESRFVLPEELNSGNIPGRSLSGKDRDLSGRPAGRTDGGSTPHVVGGASQGVRDGNVVAANQHSDTKGSGGAGGNRRGRKSQP